MHFARQARQKYGDKLLTASPNMTATHFLHEKGNTPSLRAAAMDQWLFGLADFHVSSNLTLNPRAAATNQWLFDLADLYLRPSPGPSPKPCKLPSAHLVTADCPQVALQLLPVC